MPQWNVSTFMKRPSHLLTHQHRDAGQTTLLLSLRHSKTVAESHR